MGQRILLAGGTGFIGRSLTRYLIGQGHDVIVLSRDRNHAQEILPEAVGYITWSEITNSSDCPTDLGIDVIINLAGESIAQGRWSKKRKDKLISSRIEPVNALSHFISCQQSKPSLYLQASAIGYYGYNLTCPVTESAGRGEGFLAKLCDSWENSAIQLAEKHAIRLKILRFGIVLGRDGGFLSPIKKAFNSYLGGYPGDGHAWMSWIHLQDVLGIILFLLDRRPSSRLYNLVTPEAITVKDFYTRLGQVLDKPVWLPMPKLLLQPVLGEMAKELIFSDQQVKPEQLIADGYSFHFADLNDALNDIFRPNQA